MKELEAAWNLREKLGVFKKSEAVRVFHGESDAIFREIAIDRFKDHYWITQWSASTSAALAEIAEFLKARGAKSAVHLLRPEQGVPADPEVLFGEPPQEKFTVAEGRLKFGIQLQGTKHPGLFLDHLPLREWLQENSKGLSVLNTFAYTGSLSVAAGVGGAAQVTTLDLSKPTIEWARENWALNGLSEKSADFIYGDYFEWLPRFAKKKREFDLVILDPPSFSRSKKGSFSTTKDLQRLHECAFEVLSKGGILATSINSANITRKKFFYDVHLAAREKSRKLEIIREIELPQTFPTRTSSEADRYLKGWILRCE
jgi:23S rRNA (cytosine1962-C5)-methyltransferase